MKKLKFLVFALPAMLVGCSSDDNNDGNGGQTGLNGEWHLVEVLHGFAGGSSEFEEGEVTWIIDQSEMSVEIENNSTDEYSGHATGTYDYTFEEIDEVCDNAFVIGDENYGCMNLDGDELSFSQSSLDGPVYRFTR